MSEQLDLQIQAELDAIREAGFEPQLRNQEYKWRELPSDIEEQVSNSYLSDKTID